MTPPTLREILRLPRTALGRRLALTIALGPPRATAALGSSLATPLSRRPPLVGSKRRVLSRVLEGDSKGQGGG